VNLLDTETGCQGLNQNNDSLFEKIDELEKLSASRQQKIQELEKILNNKNEIVTGLEAELKETRIRQQMFNEAMLKAEAQLDLLKDILLREVKL